MLDSNSHRPPRKRGLKERLNSSANTKIYLRMPDAARTIYSIMKSNEILLKLIGRFGGCTLHIPAKWPPLGQSSNYKGHALRRVLTPQQMQAMVAHYGGTDLYIPKCTKYLLQLRNNTIIQSFTKAVQQGRSTGNVVQWLARRYRLSDRRIWDILKSDAENNL